ncbi:hypothetical protein CVS42_11325 [Aeromonas veronii]|uniref:hypothetical protein n=1 Tax=Aeromonas TaxID=642 RepID=UPI00084AB866|nr:MULTISPECIES: hypothetical protein [Aeromonas]ATY81358.1 hypothetical protein CVS42_11325 [Aeromonas veronii]OEC50254.1 hypothetical protein A9G04_15910 [Aeromonas sp. ANNP30]OEC62611.1 hypothetical protein A9G49_18350 [Aeromonas sp. ANP5]
MRIEEPIKFFGSAAKAANAIGYNRVCFNDWKRNNGGLVSPKAAARFVEASGGALDFGFSDYTQSERD